MSRLRFTREMGRQRDLKDEIDELFADLWQVSRLARPRRGFRPPLNSFRTEDPPSFTVVVELAGVEPEQIRVTAADGMLVIGGERRRLPCEGRTYEQIELEYGLFERVVRLPENADISRAEARYERGLLTIELPIAERAARSQPVPIEIQRRG
jgi:HSP20 family protein